MAIVGTVLERFEKQAPVAVMARAILAHVFGDRKIDEIFADTAERQRQGSLLFSSVVGLLHLAVLKAKPSLHSAYVSCREEVSVHHRHSERGVARL